MIMENIINILLLIIYISIFLGIAFFSQKLNIVGRIGIFILLFYSIAPFFEFSDFQFFQYKAIYIYDKEIIFFYMLTLIFVSLPFFLFFREKWEIKVPKNLDALYVVWSVALLAWLIDIGFNWRYFSLPKNEYILSLPEQTKNLIFFTIPAKEILVSFAFIPALNAKFRKICLIVAVLAFSHSLLIGVRHVAFIAVLLYFLPKMRTKGLLLMLLIMTFAGEASNVLKIMLSELSRNNWSAIYGGWWIDYLYENIGVSIEQKSILTNLMLKLKFPEMLEFGHMFDDLLAGMPMAQKVAVFLGYEFSSSVTGLSNFVGVLEGQGTAYSIQLAVVESYGFVFVVIFFVLFILSRVKAGIFYITLGELFYSMMRNGVDYWFYQFWKIIILVFVFYVLSRFFIFLAKNINRQNSMPYEK
ncbi:hypothetical protein P609_00640 [Comamonas thiooxydans]|nr:hypothetical protein P609_00640 [Comamonas thiooxydans]